MRLGLLTNDIPPVFETPCAGVAARILGLQQGLKAHGIDAEVLITHRMLSERFERWSDFMPSVFEHNGVRVFGTADWEDVSRDYDHVLCSNWGIANYLDPAALESVSLIYDFFSPTMIEFENSETLKAGIDVARGKKEGLVSRASHFIANGELIADYAQGWLRDEMSVPGADVHPAMCGLNWDGDAGRQPVFLVGGFAQEWTKELADGWLDRLAARFPEAAFVRVGHGMHYHFGKTGDEAPAATAPNIVDYPVLSFHDYGRLNRIACGMIDVSADAAERKLSLSTRAVTSLSHGCPVIHNAGTWLSELMQRAGLQTALDVTSETVEEELEEIVARLLRERNRLDVHGFWDSHLNPARTIAGLVEALKP